MIRAIVLGVALTILPGCAHVISEESRKQVYPALAFDKLSANPDSYLGKQVMFGGIIAATRNTREGGQLEVVQFDLDGSDVPQTVGGSGGRFLAISPLFLDPLVYMQGRLVTMVGEVKGKVTLPLDEADYTYPIIAIREIHVLRFYEQEQISPYPSPTYYYAPYYNGYWPWPYPVRPIGPPLGP